MVQLSRTEVKTNHGSFLSLIRDPWLRGRTEAARPGIIAGEQYLFVFRPRSAANQIHTLNAKRVGPSFIGFPQGLTKRTGGFERIVCEERT